MDVSEAKRLRALQDENGKLKRLLADSMLDNAVLKIRRQEIVHHAET
jgi:putative transposase